jgi:hypothetical protein
MCGAWGVIDVRRNPRHLWIAYSASAGGIQRYVWDVGVINVRRNPRRLWIARPQLQGGRWGIRLVREWYAAPG